MLSVVGIRNLFRREPESPEVGLLRGNYVIAVPPGVTERTVLACVRKWAPDAVRTADGRVLVTEGLALMGPVPYEQDVWRRAEMPATATAGYALVEQVGLVDRVLPEIMAEGLSRRLAGWWRSTRTAAWYEKGAGWREGLAGSRDPCVYAAHALPPERTLQLLAGCLPDPRLTEQGDDYYRLAAGWFEVAVHTPPSNATPFPIVTRQPWFVSWEVTTEYWVVTDVPDDERAPDAPDEALQAARVLQQATGGVFLDDGGFPWSDSEGPS